jgi:Helix-turn-helix domain
MATPALSQEKNTIELRGEWFEVANALIDGGLLSEMASPAVRVYLVLLRRRDAHGLCWPSRRGLARHSGVCLRSVEAALRELKAKGLLEIVRRGGPGRPNLYRVHARPRVPVASAKCGD